MGPYGSGEFAVGKQHFGKKESKCLRSRKRRKKRKPMSAAVPIIAVSERIAPVVVREATSVLARGAGVIGAGKLARVLGRVARANGAEKALQRSIWTS
jgi:hypothetical protein